MNEITSSGLLDQWRKRANELCYRAGQFAYRQREDDAHEMRVRAQVYFICADELETLSASNRLNAAE